MMRRQEAVLECHQLTGEWTYLVKLRVAHIAALDEFIVEEIRPLAGLERLAVEIALASVKETALLPCPSRAGGGGRVGRTRKGVAI
jgi:Lrp/AsnC family leucine-responsive transcriptional regulator